MCLGVLVAFGIFYGSTKFVTLCVVGRHIVELHSLTIDCGFSLFGVDILGYDLSKTEELTFVAIFLSIRIGKHRLHHRSIITDTIVNGYRRHYPFTTGQSVGRRTVFVVQCKGSAEGVCHALEHIRSADGGAGYFQFTFLIGFHNVEVAVAIYVLQSIVVTIYTMTDRNNWIYGNFDRN